MAASGDQHEIAMHLDSSRLTKFAESAVGRLLPLARYRRPVEIRRVAKPAVFGRDLFEVLSRAKIVLNGAIDMAGNDRGNMRCFEAMGCGALLLSDAGVYPAGMENDRTLVTYDSVAGAMDATAGLLADSTRRLGIAAAGNELMNTQYSKSRQWAAFKALV
jgi:spore maturation protein CgeB